MIGGRSVLIGLIAVGMAVSARASGDVCHVYIGVGPDGAIYDIGVPNMGRVRRSPRVLEEDLRGGCYNDANASPVTSVTLEVATGAPKVRVDLVYSILLRQGWPKDKVKLVIWKNSPH